MIRLISFEKAAQPDLDINRLKKLGQPRQLFSFVGSYDELVGYKVRDALQATGVEYQNGNQVSAIIFPLKTDLYPANARGLVQVIQKIEAQKTIEIKERFFQGGNLPTDDEKEELGYRSLDSYKLDYLKDKYTHYCQLSYRFMCDKPNYTARELLGNIGRDWSPLGYSRG